MSWVHHGPAIHLPMVSETVAAEIRGQLDAPRRWLSMPADVYPHYLAWRLRDLQRYIRLASVPLVLLTMVLTLVSNNFFSGELNPRDTRLWTWGSLSVCICLTLAVAFAQSSWVQARYAWLAVPCATLLLAKFIAMPQLLDYPLAAAAESYFCMIALAVISLALRLTLGQAAITIALGGLLGLGASALYSPDAIDWRSLSYHYFAMASICLYLGGLFEENEKTGFLQALLLQRDAAELAKLNNELSRLAHQDALSGLANRREFDRRLLVEWERSRRERRPLAVLFIDVDHFKAYNDHYGHAAGDDCLSRVGGAIGAALLRPADLAARYGGEEFVVLLPETDEAGASDVARRLLAGIDALAILHAGSGTSPHVTASIGVAVAQPFTGSPQALLKRADGALYDAKHAGRHQIVIAPALAGETDEHTASGTS